MKLQIRAKEFNPRFPVSFRYATFRTGKDPVMDPAIEPTDAVLEADADKSERPRASDWLWRPWYAKLWWAAISTYWAGKVGSLYSPALDEFYTSAFAGFLNVAFFPPLALMLLGLGFARAWLAWSDWEFIETTQDDLFRRPLIDPYTDPSNPLSGAIYRRHHRH